MADDRRAPSRPGASYKDDAYYRPIEAPLERQMGLPDGLLSRIRKDGEKTDRDRVSPAGARSVYQIIPGTRDLFMNKYNVNAYASDAAAAKVAALHLKESYDRSGGDLERTVREYHGGPNKANWGEVNAAYASRVLGKQLTREVRGTTALRPGLNVRDLSYEDVKDIAPADIGSRKRLRPKPVTAAEAAPAVTPGQLVLGGIQDIDVTPGAAVGDLTAEVRATNGAVQAETDRKSITTLDRFEAAMDRNWITSMLGRALDHDLYEGDKAWHKEYVDNQDDMEAFAENQDELDLVRSSRAQHSREDYFKVRSEIEATRKRNQIVNSTGRGWAFDLSASLADPVGWVATLGVGKAVQGIGAIGRAGKAALSARPSLTAMAVEGAATNLAFTGLMDASGETQTYGDYLMAGALGATIGSVLHTVTSPKGRLDTSDQDLVSAIEQRGKQELDALHIEATSGLGADAGEDAVQEAVTKSVGEASANKLNIATAARGDEDRFLPANVDEWKTHDLATATRMTAGSGIDRIGDAGTRRTAAEVLVRSREVVERAVAAGHLEKGLEGWLLKRLPGNLESDGLTLIRSGNPVLMASAIQLLEVTTGAGGRKASAAIDMVTRQRDYMRHIIGFDQNFDIWRRAEGIGKFKAIASKDVKDQFDTLVQREILARGTDGAELTTNNAVKRAADSLEAGFNEMRMHSQTVGTLGHERLGTTSKGYLPQLLSAVKISRLNPKQRANLENVFARQFRALNEYTYIDKVTKEKITKNFDDKFSRELAKEYVNKAEGRAMGNAYAPANLQNGDSADVISDALKEIHGLAPEAREAILGRFSRGGSAHTKGRLKLNLLEDLGDGMVLGDLFNNNLVDMYRTYSRRVSGEIALAKYGVLGKQTLEIMRETARVTGAKKSEIEAFERVTSEFLGVPWSGAKNWTAAKNMRSITSASMLGGMAFPQAAEWGNALPALGVRAVLNNVAGIPRLMKEVKMFRKGGKLKNPILNDFDEIYGFAGGEDYTHTRIFDAPEENVDLYDTDSIGTLSKFARAGSHFNSVVSGFRILHAVQTRGMAEQIVRKAVRYIHLDKASGALDDMGITPEIRQALKANMDKIAKFDDKGNLVELKLMGDHGIPPRIIAEFAQTIERGAGQIIQKTFIGETGAWAHNDFLKLLLQFRTFGITSVEKQYGRNRANYGAIKSAMILIGSAGFALPIHLTRLGIQSQGMSRSEREEFMDKNLNVLNLSKALMTYTSSAGLLPDVMDTMVTFGSKTGLLPKDLSDGVSGRQPGLSSMVPSISFADNAIKGTVGAQPDKLLKLLPGSNLPAVAPIINGLTQEDEE